MTTTPDTTSRPDGAAEIFATASTFASLGLSEPVLRAVEEQGFVHPTKVQAELIPLAMAGKDVMGQSKTGTGKTAAFCLPILERVKKGDGFGALVLVPTRELAIQVAKEMRNLSAYSGQRVVPIYGGQPMKIQGPKLAKSPEIIVGTPGRIMDFHGRGQLPYDRVKLAVLDEVDRMLDIGFRDDIRRILGGMRHKHQTIFVSATISPEIDRLAARYMHDPERLAVAAGSLTVEMVQQWYLNVERWDKNRLLVHLLKKEDPALTLVFCRTKTTVDGLTRYLQRKGIDAHSIHGDMYQGKRNKVMEKLRSGELSVVVASDLAARGIDVDDITHVINYDLPEDPEIYVHRIGRTARVGRNGVAWSFVTPEQGNILTAIEQLANIEIPLIEYDDFQPAAPPADIAAARERDQQLAEQRREKYDRLAIAPPTEEEAHDETRFPGGVAPISRPGKRLGGRVRHNRR